MSNLTHEKLEQMWKRLDNFPVIIHIEANPLTIIKLEHSIPRTESKVFPGTYFGIPLHENTTLPENYIKIVFSDGRVELKYLEF